MRLTIGDLVTYAYCPWYQEDSPDTSWIRPPIKHDITQALVDVLKFIFVRELETKRKQPWQTWSNKWLKIFWKEHDLDDDNSTATYDAGAALLRDLYNWAQELEGETALVNFEYVDAIGDDRLASTVPVVRILENSDLELIFFDVSSDIDVFRRDLYVRSGSMAIARALPDQKIAAIRGVYINPTKFNFKEVQIHPNEAFYQRTVQTVSGLIRSIKQDLRYINHLGCPKCPIKTRCKR